MSPADSPVSFTVGEGATTAVVATNTFTEVVVEPGTGGFSLAKAVAGSGAAAVADVEFTFEYTVDGVQQDPIVLAGGASESVEGLAAGAAVVITEVAPVVPDGVTFDGVAFTLNGEPADSPVSFTVGEGATTAVVATNTFTEDPTDPTDPVDPTDPTDPSKPIVASGLSASPALLLVAGLLVMLGAGALLLAGRRLGGQR